MLPGRIPHDRRHGQSSVDTDQGAANKPVIRFGYKDEFADAIGGMITEPIRPNARDISNAIFAQPASHKNARGLSDLCLGLGPIPRPRHGSGHDEQRPATNGTAPIAVNSPDRPARTESDPLHAFEFFNNPEPRLGAALRQRSHQLHRCLERLRFRRGPSGGARTNGGTGAKLLTSGNNLLPFNTAGLPNENNGPTPAYPDVPRWRHPSQRELASHFAAHDLCPRAQPPGRRHRRESAASERRRAVPTLSEARRRRNAGHHVQGVPAGAAGHGSSVPKVEQHVIQSADVPATITNAFAHATYRFGHSMVSPQLKLVDADGTRPAIALRNAFFNPALITGNPALVDQLLAGASMQRSEEIDTLVIDDLRNFLFGPPGAGGLDLAALNIQRGRDVGLPDYRQLRTQLQKGTLAITDFSQITADAGLADSCPLCTPETSIISTPGSAPWPRTTWPARASARLSRPCWKANSAASATATGCSIAQCGRPLHERHAEPRHRSHHRSRSLTLADMILANTSITASARECVLCRRSRRLQRRRQRRRGRLCRVAKISRLQQRLGRWRRQRHRRPGRLWPCGALTMAVRQQAAVVRLRLYPSQQQFCCSVPPSLRVCCASRAATVEAAESLERCPSHL